MPISDTKKAQTLINLVANNVEILQAAASNLEAAKDAFQAHGVDPTGTPLDGHVTQINGWINDIRAAANHNVANGFLANRVPSHKNKALGDV